MANLHTNTRYSTRPEATGKPKKQSASTSIIRGFIPMDKPAYYEDVCGPVEFFSHAIPQIYGCSSRRAFNLTGLAGEYLAGNADMSVSFYPVLAGTELRTVRPGKREHSQRVKTDGIVVDLCVDSGSLLLPLFKRLQSTGRKFGLSADIRPVAGAWRDKRVERNGVTTREPVYQCLSIKLGNSLRLCRDDNGAGLTIID